MSFVLWIVIELNLFELLNRLRLIIRPRFVLRLYCVHSISFPFRTSTYAILASYRSLAHTPNSVGVGNLAFNLGMEMDISNIQIVFRPTIAL